MAILEKKIECHHNCSTIKSLSFLLNTDMVFGGKQLALIKLMENVTDRLESTFFTNMSTYISQDSGSSHLRRKVVQVDLFFAKEYLYFRGMGEF